MKSITDSAIISCFLMSAGITFSIALINALICHAYENENKKIYFYFSILSFCETIYLVSSAHYYSSTSIAEVITALKWQVSSAILVLYPLFLFIAAYTKQANSKPWSTIILIVSLGLFINNLYAPYSIRFIEITGTSSAVLPWGEVITYYKGEIGNMRVARIIALSIFLWGIFKGLNLCRQGFVKQGFYLILSLLLIIASVIWGALIDREIIHSFYTVGFAFLSLVILMSISLANQIKEQANKIKISAATFDIQDPVVVTDNKQKIIQINQAFEEATNYNSKEVSTQDLWQFHSEDQNNKTNNDIPKELQKYGVWSGELLLKNKNRGHQPNHAKITGIKNANGEIINYVVIYRNRSEIKKIESYVDFIKAYDSLTGLPNRVTFLNYQEDLAQNVSAEPAYSALLIVNLDKFQTINDTLGHDAGNIMLHEVAYRLKSEVPDTNCLARLTGDEFAIAFNAVHQDQFTAERLIIERVNKLIDVLNRPYMLNNREYLLSASIGITLYQNNNFQSQELMQQAHIAMIKAKSNGGGCVHFFEQKLQDKLIYESNLEKDLRNAIKNNEFQLFFQVQIDQHFSPIAAEALIRWDHPTRGLISPAEFIPVAEESTLILNIGTWVLSEACRCMKKWELSPSLEKLSLSVNVSAKQFLSPNFVNIVKSLVARYGIDPTKLKLEITESVVIKEKENVIVKLLELREKVGVKLSLDDFGTGYSSLSYLKNLPLDEIKIDQSFVKNITINDADNVIAKTIIDLAKNLKLRVVAEGVETKEQLNILKHYQCDAFQGFLFSKPIPLEHFELLIKKIKTPA